MMDDARRAIRTTMLNVAGPAGRLEAVLDEPGDQVRCAAVFAHPHPLYGGSMRTKVVFQGAKALASIGCATLRFNLRGVGLSAGTFDEGRGERDDFRAAVDHVAALYPGLPIWAAGFSFGSWIAGLEGAADHRITAIITIAPPVERADFDPVVQSGKPTFVIAGERDEICPLAGVRRFYASLDEPKELVVIDAADHLFDGKVGEMADALRDLLEDFGPPGAG